MIYDKKLKSAKIIDFLQNDLGEKIKKHDGIITLKDDIQVYETFIIDDLRSCINDMTKDMATKKLDEYEYELAKIGRDRAKATLQDLLEFANRKYKVKRFVRAKNGVVFDLKKCECKKVSDGLVINGKKYLFYDLISDGNSLYDITQKGDQFMLKNGNIVIPKVNYKFNKRELWLDYKLLKPRKIRKNLTIKVVEQ